jgi:hypothetical protein
VLSHLTKKLLNLEPSAQLQSTEGESSFRLVYKTRLLPAYIGEIFRLDLRVFRPITPGFADIGMRKYPGWEGLKYSTVLYSTVGSPYRR